MVIGGFAVGVFGGGTGVFAGCIAGAGAGYILSGVICTKRPGNLKSAAEAE